MRLSLFFRITVGTVFIVFSSFKVLAAEVPLFPTLECFERTSATSVTLHIGVTNQLNTVVDKPDINQFSAGAVVYNPPTTFVPGYTPNVYQPVVDSRLALLTWVLGQESYYLLVQPSQLSDTNLCSRGATGPQGVPGVAGPAGPMGSLGPAGSVGPQGPAGAQGSIGPQGTQGVKGDPGAQGQAGSPGPTGPQGPAGIKGDKGESGIRGPSGLLRLTSCAPISVTIRSSEKNNFRRLAVATCPKDQVIISGGGSCSRGLLQSSNRTGTNSWSVKCLEYTDVTATATCCPLQ